MRDAWFAAYQKKYSADRFRASLLQTNAVLKDRMGRLQAAGVDVSSRPQVSEEDPGGVGLLEATEGVLSSALSAHLVLCRMALLYPWRERSYAATPTLLLDEISELAGSLLGAWRLLGVSGEAQRQIVKRLIVVVGQQTLSTRQQIDRAHHQQLYARISTVGDTRADAALRETEGGRAQGRAVFRNTFRNSKPCMVD